MFHVKHHSVKVRARISTKAPPLPAISIFPITRANSSNVSRETSLCNPNTEEQCTGCTRNTTQPLPHHEYHSATNHHDEPAPQATIGRAFGYVSRETSPCNQLPQRRELLHETHATCLPDRLPHHGHLYAIRLPDVTHRKQR